MIFILTKNAKLTFPVTPSGIGPKGGDTQITEVQTLHRGVIPFTDGTGLEEVSWTSFFSFNKVYGEEVRHDPYKAVAALEQIKKAEEPVILCITELNYQKEMLLKTFDYWIEKPGFIEFSIAFREYRDIKLGVLNGNGEVIRPPSNNMENYALKTAKVTGDAYMIAVRDVPSQNGKVIGTVKKGDTVTLARNAQGEWLYIQMSNVHGYVLASNLS